jgi:hypothetical protein
VREEKLKRTKQEEKSWQARQEKEGAEDLGKLTLKRLKAIRNKEARAKRRFLVLCCTRLCGLCVRVLHRRRCACLAPLCDASNVHCSSVAFVGLRV